MQKRIDLSPPPLKQQSSIRLSPSFSHHTYAEPLTPEKERTQQGNIALLPRARLTASFRGPVTPRNSPIGFSLTRSPSLYPLLSLFMSLASPMPCLRLGSRSSVVGVSLTLMVGVLNRKRSEKKVFVQKVKNTRSEVLGKYQTWKL